MIFLRRPLVLVLVLLVGFWAFSELGYRKLANPDEGRYSEIAREMADSGDFVTPRLNGLKYFEKPPLQYWATAVAFKLFGEGEFSARLYTFLCGIGCILLIAYTGSRLFDHEAGAMAALVLLGAPYFMMLSEIVTLDMGLTFWMTLGICGFLLGQADARDQQRRRWMLLAWAGMAGAVLSDRHCFSSCGDISLLRRAARFSPPAQAGMAARAHLVFAAGRPLVCDRFHTQSGVCAFLFHPRAF
jgi:4-amino-4-deoxy-L-arabinose transferase-like glycosyltransferase